MIKRTNNSRKNGLTAIEILLGISSVAIATLTITAIVYGIRAASKYVNTPAIKVERANVIGDSRAEQFIDFNGKRWYSEVDGASIYQYLNQTKSEKEIR